MSVQERLLEIVRAVAEGGPPVRYNDGMYLPDSREDGTYDCLFCGPSSITLAKVNRPDGHAVTCPWRMAAELLDGLKGDA